MFGRGRGLLSAAQRGSIPWCGRCASGSYHVPEEGVEGDGEDGCNEAGVGHVHIAEELCHGCNIHLGGERQLLGSGGACGGTEPHTQRGCLHPKPNALQERINLSMSPSLNLAKLRVQSQKEGWGLPQNRFPPCLREPRVCSGAQKDPGAVRTCCCEDGHQHYRETLHVSEPQGRGHCFTASLLLGREDGHPEPRIVQPPTRFPLHKTDANPWHSVHRCTCIISCKKTFLSYVTTTKENP